MYIADDISHTWSKNNAKAIYAQNPKANEYHFLIVGLKNPVTMITKNKIIIKLW